MIHPEIVPGILAANDDEYHTKLTAVENLVTRVQIEIADGDFVRTETIGAPTLEGYATEVLLDVHLLVKNPPAHALEYSRVGVDQMVIPFETLTEINKLKGALSEIHNLGHNLGLSLEIETPLSVLDDLADDLDFVELMSVASGAGRQEFDERVLPRLASLRQRFPEMNLAVKGGLSLKNIGQAREAGANIFVVGSHLFGAESVHDYLERLRSVVRSKD